MSGKGFYRVKVEEPGVAEGPGARRALVLRVYRDGVEVEAVTFDLSASGAQGLLDEVRYLEWTGHEDGSATDLPR